jgi:hypothetical protein
MQQAADFGMAPGKAIHGSEALCAFPFCSRMIRPENWTPHFRIMHDARF